MHDCVPHKVKVGAGCTVGLSAYRHTGHICLSQQARLGLPHLALLARCPSQGIQVLAMTGTPFAHRPQRFPKAPGLGVPGGTLSTLLAGQKPTWSRLLLYVWYHGHWGNPRGSIRKARCPFKEQSVRLNSAQLLSPAPTLAIACTMGPTKWPDSYFRLRWENWP